jgi:hypothetical protein
MPRYLLALLVTLTFLGEGKASEYYVGQTIKGYTLSSDGFWYLPGNPTCYTIDRVYDPYITYSYDSCGRRYGAAYYSYNFIPVPTKTVTVQAPPPPAYTPPVSIPPFQPGWKEQVAKSYDKVLEYQAYSNAILPLQQLAQVGQAGLMANPAYGGFNIGSYNLGSFGANGSTILGYATSYKAASGQYDYNPAAMQQGQLEALALLNQSYARTVGNAQVLAGDGQNGLKALAQQVQGDIARNLEFQTKAEATRRLWAPVERTEFHTHAYVVDRTGRLSMNPSYPGNPSPEKAEGTLGAAWAQSANRCVKCHSGASPSGGFSVETFPTLSPDKQDIVLARLSTDDPKVLMPRDDKGQGVHLPPQELAIWYQVRGKPMTKATP